ncbi:hypothetical protein GMJAKD_16635 [Candidatus Electrothrix aarhusensis]
MLYRVQHGIGAEIFLSRYLTEIWRLRKVRSDDYQVSKRSEQNSKDNFKEMIGGRENF